MKLESQLVGWMKRSDTYHFAVGHSSRMLSRRIDLTLVSDAMVNYGALNYSAQRRALMEARRRRAI